MGFRKICFPLRPIGLSQSLARAQRLRQQGSVELRIHVGVAGLVTRVEVTRTSGYSLLDEAAVRAVESWRFEPALRRGRPVPDAFEHTVTFRLTDGVLARNRGMRERPARLP